MECLGVRSLQVFWVAALGTPCDPVRQQVDQHAVGVSCHLLSSGAMQLQWGARLVACSLL